MLLNKTQFSIRSGSGLLTILFLGITGIFPNMLHGQQLPVFHQKFTDDFLFNPGYTGLSGGSASASFRRIWTGIEDPANAYYISGHTLLAQDKIGIGGNLFFEQLSFINNLRIAPSISYQIIKSEDYSVSFGISPELYQTRLDRGELFVRDPDDPLLLNPDEGVTFDVSSGIVFSSSRINAGVGFNRMVNFWEDDDNDSGVDLLSIISLSASGLIPLRYGYDVFEPRIFYNITPDGRNLLNVSGFYNYENIAVAGVTYRTNSVGVMSLGWWFENRILFSYSVEYNFSNAGRDLGVIHELTLRIDFNKQYFQRVNPANQNPRESSTFRKRR
ncbi:MAG: PorP/SprF family type IX secretion system membrane protein [Bacteroidota bacterium]